MLDPEQNLLPVSGTKEGLFLAAIAVVPEEKRGQRPAVLIPNPYYLVYAGAAAVSGADIVYLDATQETGFLPDLDALDEATLARTAAFYLCSPANPQGAIASLEYLKRAIELARAYDFVLVADECYAEIYDRAAPPGALEACAALGDGFDHVVVFHSLSKRSSAAGLRSGFVAGDAKLIAHYSHLRSYGGCQVPLPVQAAAAALWRDEAHVEENRAKYRRKFDIAEAALAGRYGFYRPEGGFFLWLEVGDGEAAALRLWRDAAVRVLPGGYTARAADGRRNPGEAYIRLAIVHDEATLSAAFERIRRVL
jgi:aspartate/methionine/tyrosine aminotransferase